MNKFYALLAKAFFPTLLLCLLLIGVGRVQAQSSMWRYQVPVTIVETSGSDVYNYQVRLTLDTQTPVAMNKMMADGSDIRFTNDCSSMDSIPYYIEGYMNTDTTKIWVLLDTLAANDTITIYMTSGAPSLAAASTIEVFNGPYSAHDSVIPSSTNSVVSNSSRGFLFTTTEDLLVARFGKREPTGTTRFVTLWDVATSSIIYQDTVSGPTGIYTYKDIAPFWITSGTQYILSLFQGSGDGYYFGTSTAAGEHINYSTMRYCNSCTESTFPTSSLGGYHYGVPDIHYYTRTRPSSEASYTVGSAYYINEFADYTGCPGTMTTFGDTATGGVATYAYAWSPTSGVSDTTASPTMVSVDTMTITYTLSSTDARGCVVYEWADVSSYPATLLSGIVSDATCESDSNGSIDLTASGSTGYSYFWNTGSTSEDLSGLPAGTYNVSVVDTNGCTYPDTFTVNFMYTNPTVNLGADTTLCDGASVTLDASASGLTGYAWSTSDTSASISVNTAGTYSVVVTDSNTCTGTDSVTVSTAVTPTSDFSADTSGCPTVNFSDLSTGSPASWSWNFGDGGSSTSASPSNTYGSNGTYTVELTTTNGCGSDTTTMDITISCIVSIDEGILGEAVNIYPNPNNGVFSIEIEGLQQQTAEILVLDLNGKTVFQKMISNMTSMELTNVDLQNLSKGTYFAKVKVGEHELVRKVMIQ